MTKRLLIEEVRALEPATLDKAPSEAIATAELSESGQFAAPAAAAGSKKTPGITDFISGILVSATLEEVEAAQVFSRRRVAGLGYAIGVTSV